MVGGGSGASPSNERYDVLIQSVLNVQAQTVRNVAHRRTTSPTNKETERNRKHQHVTHLDGCVL